MTAGEPQFDGVLESLRQARKLLVDPVPQNIDRCRALMAQCAEQMAVVAQDPRQVCADSIHQVREQIASIASLLSSAAAFHRDLLQAMRSVACSTVVTAEIPSEERVRRLHVLC